MTVLITGVANKKSVATHVATTLLEKGQDLIFSVQNEDCRQKVLKLFPGKKVYLCDVEKEDDIASLKEQLSVDGVKLTGLLHSIAFANLVDPKPFHETSFQDFSQAINISSFSLVSLSNALKDFFTDDASVVTISISDTKATSYGYMGPVKAMLDNVVAYLAKSFSQFSEIRFNAVCSGPLKTSASAGIPGYIDNYLFAEKLTLRKRALHTQEVANVACFLLGDESSGINATGIKVDAGMSCNHFDQDVVKKVSK